MEFLKELARLFDADIYKKWKEENNQSYLAHGVFFEEANAVWQIGFYHPDRDTLTVFDMEQQVTQRPEEKAFKEGDSIAPLDASSIKTSFMHVHDIMENKLQEMKETAIKKFFIIQHLPQGTVWNNTYVTKTFKTMNLKIDAETGEIVEEKVQNILDMAQQVK